MFQYLLILLLSLSSLSFSQTHKGNISGKVIDARTQEPIPSVNIILIEQPEIGTTTDVNGNFSINKINVGTYSLKVSAIGYTRQIVTNIVVTTGRSTPITIKLKETVLELEGVTVTTDYYSSENEVSPVSSTVIARSEILRSPGGIQDVQRVVQNFPGVASSTDNINELIVRGGAPFENLTVMDNMEIPSINHFANQFNSAGPINMVNADMIEDVQFSTGGFTAQYGDKSSSVMNLKVREGNRNVSFSSKTILNMAGIGTLIEGGFANKRGSYILSIRNSLLEIIDKIFGISKLSLTAVPKYWDVQSKITYDISQTNKLSFNLLYGDSRIFIKGDPKAKDELRKNILDSSSVETLYPIIKQFALGFNLRSLFGKNGYSILTLYSSGTKITMDVQEDFAVRQRDANGDVQSYKILNTRNVFSNHSYESFLGAKYEVFYQIHPRHNLTLGIAYGTSLNWANDVYLVADTVRFFGNQIVVTPPYEYHSKIGLGKEGKYYLFASHDFRISKDVLLTFGMRYDYFSYSRKSSLSPRVSIKYNLIQPTTSLTFATGRYTQTHPLPYYGDYQQKYINKYLDNMYADHYVLGFEHIIGEGLKLNIETYYKFYNKLAVSEDFVYSSDPTFWSDKMLTIGKRRSYGLEFFLEQKQVSDLFGTLSISLSKSEMKDPRIPKLVEWYNSEYDYPVIVTALGGKVVKGLRNWLNSKPFFIKYPSYLLPVSDEMEISFKYRYQSGRPYTPNEFVLWKQKREGGVAWSKGAWIPTLNENSVRFPDYSRLDLQLLSRFYMEKWNINIYIALMNVFDRKNIFFENYRSDGTVETVYQFTFFPVFGLEVEW